LDSNHIGDNEGGGEVRGRGVIGSSDGVFWKGIVIYYYNIFLFLKIIFNINVLK